MPDQAMDELGRATDKVAGDLKAVIADGQALLEAAATVSDEGFVAMRTKFEENTMRAKVALQAASRSVYGSTRAGAAAADEYVRGHPWAAVGFAATAGVLIGLLAARR